MKPRQFFIVVTIAGAWLAAPASAGAQAQVEQGQKVYRELRCQTCHSIAGVGNRRNPLDGVGSRLTEEQIRTWIVAPKEMKPDVRKPAYPKLAKERLEALVAYLASLKEDKER